MALLTTKSWRSRTRSTPPHFSMTSRVCCRIRGSGLWLPAGASTSIQTATGLRSSRPLPWKPSRNRVILIFNFFDELRRIAPAPGRYLLNPVATYTEADLKVRTTEPGTFPA